MYSAYITEKDNLKEDLIKSLEFIDWKKQVKKDSTVFIKPNFTFPYYKKGITTSPELLKNLLEIIKNRADKVIVGKSDGGNHSFSADKAFKGYGMYEICKEVDVELIENGALREYGVKARGFVEKYSWKNIADVFGRVLEEVIRGGKYE